MTWLIYPLQCAPLDQLPDSFLKDLDKVIRSAVKEMISLPDDTPNDMLYSSKKVRGLGLIKAEWEANIQHFNICKRLSQVSDDHLLLVRNLEEEKKTALKRLKIPEANITPRTTGIHLCDELRKRSFDSWCQLPHKGKGVVIYEEYPRANSWVSTKRNLSSSEYINAIKMPCNLTAVRSVPGRAFSTTRCRQPGCNETETLGHVLGFCRKEELLRNNRHHRVRGAIACLLRNKGWEVHEEVHCISEDDSHRRADIIAINRQQQKAIIIDPTIRMERDLNQAHQVDQEKRAIYEPCIPYFSAKYNIPLFNWSEESSEEQLNTFHQSVEGSSLPTCGSNEDGHVIVTPKTEYESHNTCDNLSAYEVFNLSAYEVLGLHKTLHGEGSAVILVKDEDVKDNNNDEDSDNDNDDNPSDTLESSVEQEISSYPYDQLCKILLDRCNADDECYYFSDNSYYYSVEDKKEMVKKEVSVEKFHCQHCGKGFFSAVSFRQHLKIDHTELNELRCISCNDTFESISDLQFHKAVHVRNTGGDGPYLCSVCGKTFGMLSTLKSHERRVHPNHENGSDDSDIKYKCEECGKEFQLQEYLKRHMMKHGEKNFVCETCGKRFETLYILKLHQESHSEVRPYGCKICGSSYKRYRNLLSHRQEVHGIYAIGPRKPKDPLKPRSKSKKGLLKRFPCDVCNKAFSTRGKVAVHMRTHTGERPFRCDTCGNTYPYSSSLYVHRKVVHEGRQRVEKGSFLCNVCNKTFSTRNYLDVHRRTHTGEKPYVCTVCNRAFSQRTSLINHTALHTDARPYDCTFCNKAFRRRETLLVHIRTHTGEKPYVCEICNRGFAQLTDMKKHRLKIHNAPPLKRRLEESTNRQKIRQIEEDSDQDGHHKMAQPEFNVHGTYDNLSAYEVFGLNTGHSKSVESEMDIQFNSVMEVTDINNFNFNFSDIRDNKTVKHSKKQHLHCRYCGKEFKSNAVYRKHLKIEHNGCLDFRCSNYSKKQFIALTSTTEEPSSNEEGTNEDCNSLSEDISQPNVQEPYDDLCAYEVFGLLDSYVDSKEPSEFETDFNSEIYVNDDHNYFVNDCVGDLMDMSFESKERSGNGRPQPSQCHYCDKMCTSITSLKKHLKQEHKDLKEFSCKVCNETFLSKKALQTHKSFHDQTTYSDSEEGVHLCHTCGKTFNAASKLRCHEKRAHQEIQTIQDCEKKHICEVCGLSFQFNKYLKKHMLKHGEKNFVCETCGKRFETNYKLKMHQECHSEQRPYACKICGSAYKRHRNLLSHEQEVHGIFSLGPGKEKESLSFPCDVCKKEFTTPKRAAAHMRIHTGERPFQCEQCGSTFRIYQSLMVHRRVVHEGRKVYGNKGLFPCHICRKIFSTKHYRNEHVRIHTGERPYVCKICGRAFTHATSLIQHKALHSDIRPYPCKVCDKAFRRRETLIMHIRTHTGEKPYVCDICGRGFAQLTDMKKHRLKIHNVSHQKESASV
ncbi:hypothetical protein ANN_23771 [Periplaneta americana]|uniref:C2H2-type domain-containing protein n=1 Tax=Periplaneta americana TaxID=6978 RepID=A0ABQ8SP32_PERAM|nr:hypothetical protein ANN_23771 [Periplaneta americana]